MREPLRVLLTVDTEAWPRSPALFRANPADDIRRDIFGRSEHGEYGLEYKMAILNDHGLKGVFMVESLLADVVGIEPLRDIVEAVQVRGHEIQLHLHPEWLEWMPQPLLRGRTGKFLKDFTEEDQLILLTRGLRNLRAAGAHDVCAFRAGNYGAGFTTLRALARLGITYDSSYNFTYLDTACGLRTPEPLLQPSRVEGVWEIPITSFIDYPGHRRHAQICACSFREMRLALRQAYEQGWHTFVIVSHSFELLRRREREVPPLPDGVVIHRFKRLCRYLAEHHDMFRTVGFCELDPVAIAQPLEGNYPAELRSNVFTTTLRHAEQAGRHFQSQSLRLATATSRS